jgi:signal transduction histidine kinase
MFYNDGYRPMLGENKHPQFLGASGRECWAEIWDVIGPMMERVIETGEATWSEDLFLLMLRYGYLEETYFTFSYSPIRDETGRPRGIFNACTESTARVVGERRMKTLREMAVEARGADEAASLCAQILGRNARDTPFALVYLLDGAGARLRLAGHAGLEPGSPASPLVVATAESDGGWPLARVAKQGRPELVENLSERFPGLPEEPWNEPPRQAMLLPIPRPGTPEPAGVLALGISPRRAFDDAYRGFFELAASHVATAVSSARAYEMERERAEKLAEIDRVKTAFFSNVSHEFRTPLTLILGPVEDALRDPGKCLGGDGLEAVHRSALRLLRLVNSLLDFARLEAGRLQSSFEPTDLSVLTGGLVGSFQSLVESAGLRLVVDCPRLPEPVFVDRAQWEKIVLNLVSNAFKFTLEGEIVVGLRVNEGHVQLSVRDTGTGIPAGELPRIFDRFHRVPGARGRSFEGTGIGLALVQELVRQHGGSVRVESVVGEGSTFVVEIPRGCDHLPKDKIASGGVDGRGAGASPHLLEAAAWRAPGSGGPGGSTVGGSDLRADSIPTVDLARRARVLIADDNADMREYLVRLLAPRWTVVAFEDGQAAVDAALQHPPDLVLSDVMMPRMDGIALLRSLRGDPRTKTIPIVLLSARAGEEAVVAGLETGADDYLVKPFSALELMTRVTTHLELARARRAAAEAASELAETRAALLADLERKNKELEAFSYSVSHDLRGPLRSVEAFSRALEEECGQTIDARGKDHLRRVRGGAQRMEQIIDDLLQLSGVGWTELRRERASLTDIARAVAADLLGKHSGRKVEVRVEEGLLMDADPRLLRVAVENLLGNAWKFTAGTEVAHIEVGATTTSAQGTVYFVRDNGAGFDMKLAHELFRPFRRLHSESEFPGTGIGLATVRRVVERHQGCVWAEAEEGRGATFYFTIAAG